MVGAAAERTSVGRAASGWGSGATAAVAWRVTVRSGGGAAGTTKPAAVDVAIKSNETTDMARRLGLRRGAWRGKSTAHFS